MRGLISNDSSKFQFYPLSEHFEILLQKPPVLERVNTSFMYCNRAQHGKNLIFTVKMINGHCCGRKKTTFIAEFRFRIYFSMLICKRYVKAERLKQKTKISTPNLLFDKPSRFQRGNAFNPRYSGLYDTYLEQFRIEAPL